VDPLLDLSAYEDYHLSQHILSKVYLWVEFSSPCVTHMIEIYIGTLNKACGKIKCDESRHFLKIRYFTHSRQADRGYA